MLDFPRWKVLSIIGFLAALCALAIPSFLPEETVKNWPIHPRINLGLDLAGGSYLLLEANSDQLIQSRLAQKKTEVATDMRRGKIGIGDISTDGGKITFMLRDISQLEDARQLLSQKTTGVGTTGQRDWDIAVINGSTFVLSQTKAGIDYAIDSAMDGATEVVRKRIDALGTREPTIIKQGTTRIVVQVPGLQDPTALKALLGKTATLQFKLVDTSADGTQLAKGIAPIGDQILPYPAAAGYRAPFISSTPYTGPTLKIGDAPYTGPVIAVRNEAIITGKNLTDARAETDSDNPGAWAVGFQFDTEGGRNFAKTTQANVGKPFAIILDDAVISAPNIQTPILGGSGRITGGYDAKGANDLAIQLKSGALPVALKVVEESSVGPDLGKDSIHAGIKASIIAVVLVVLFMLVTYGRFGVYANWAVVINVMVIMGVLALINGTLTLPGIAGFVLTIGTAVDANVLINERIREERRRGRSVIQSVELGYKEASRTIFEANMTHAISGVIMFLLGSGPVKGFAVVLLIGIATSVFTAVTFTRMLVVLWLRKNRPQTINI
ncbi:protein translocase subunit SecD [Sphingomonas panacisoli]|uniref:Protein translocase subunit SecD n=1 Tax=Sphingomonas panacisoli TaxID=1813879 RepID=A0A5B8LFD8_9SPHN|nr:protein translocase subunit SecD [Sphingomonas panacisoli]QDZ06434.1 protein translocase subunit SecD [Sphingomonas panacisoli]